MRRGRSRHWGVTPLLLSCFYVPITAEPFHRIRQRLPRRSLGQAQLSDRFGWIKKHLVLRHAHPCERSFGRFACYCGKRFIHMRCAESHPIGDPGLWSWHASNLLENIEGLFHCPIAFRIPQDVTLAEPPFICCQNVTDGDVTHMHPIEARVEVCGHALV